MSTGMAEIRTVTTLSKKREQIEQAIAGYEAAIQQAQVDLSHIIACMKMFEPGEDALEQAPPTYSDLTRLFKRGEMTKLCLHALSRESPLDTVQIAERVMAAKGFDPKDVVMRRAITHRVVHAMRTQVLYKTVAVAGKRHGGMRIWARA